VNLKAFFVDALAFALDVGIGTPEDVLHHVTPDVLAAHLPRPLWARLFTACLGSQKVDAQLIVETIGVPNLCEHVPTNVIWACISQIASRALGGAHAVAIPATMAQPKPTIAGAQIGRSTTPAKGVPAPTTTPSRGLPLSPLPAAAEAPARNAQPASPAAGRNNPVPGPQSLANLDLDEDERPAAPSRSRTPTGQRLRAGQTGGIARIGAASVAARRPQAQAAPAAPSARVPARGRGSTDEEFETETSVGKDWSEREIAVDDEQLVDWQAADETQTGGEGLTRKR
jgi:hypothetical protein